MATEESMQDRYRALEIDRKSRCQAKADRIGAEHRAAYTAEFGTPPVEGNVGDWDATGWEQAWAEIVRDIDLPRDDPAYAILYELCRDSYRVFLFEDDDEDDR